MKEILTGSRRPSAFSNCNSGGGGGGSDNEGGGDGERPSSLPDIRRDLEDGRPPTTSDHHSHQHNHTTTAQRRHSNTQERRSAFKKLFERRKDVEDEVHEAQQAAQALLKKVNSDKNKDGDAKDKIKKAKSQFLDVPNTER